MPALRKNVVHLDVPALPGSSSLAKAYVAMKSAGRSGVLVTSIGPKRLIHLRAIERAHKSGIKRLGDVPVFIQLASPPRPVRGEAVLKAPTRGSYVLLRTQNKMGEVLTSKSVLGGSFMLAPDLGECENGDVLPKKGAPRCPLCDGRWIR